MGGCGAAEPLPDGVPRRAEMVALAFVVIAFAAVVSIGMAANSPFSWDESVYALTIRHWVQGGPSTGVGATRPAVISVLGVVPLALGGQEWMFRIVGLLFGSLGIVAAWQLGRSMGGSYAGLLGALLLAAAPSIQLDAGLFLTDVPAMALLLLLVAFVWRAFEGQQPPGWRLVWLAPLAAFAFYTRYGSIVPLLAIGLTVPLLWPGRVAAARRPVLATVALFALLLVPHAIFATLQEGSPIGIILLARGGAAGETFGAGLEQYLAWLPSELVGPVPGLAAVLGLAVGLLHLLRAGLRGSWDRRSRMYGLLCLPAVAHILVLGLFVLPQQRYLFLPMALLMVAGSLAIADGVAGRGRIGRLAMNLVAAAVVTALIWAGVAMPGRTDGRTAYLAWERQAGLLIRELGDGSCSALAADYPQMTWYSGCPTYNFADVERSGRERLLSGENRFLVIRPDGHFQPTGAVLAEYLSKVEPQPMAELHDRTGHLVAQIYRFVGYRPVHCAECTTISPADGRRSSPHRGGRH
jgi:4-amino-4-deoxy-L-arabinose transferase-like glycosyltransferase